MSPLRSPRSLWPSHWGSCFSSLRRRATRITGPEAPRLLWETTGRPGAVSRSKAPGQCWEPAMLTAAYLQGCPCHSAGLRAGAEGWVRGPWERRSRRRTPVFPCPAWGRHQLSQMPGDLSPRLPPSAQWTSWLPQPHDGRVLCPVPLPYVLYCSAPTSRPHNLVLNDRYPWAQNQTAFEEGACRFLVPCEPQAWGPPQPSSSGWLNEMRPHVGGPSRSLVLGRGAPWCRLQGVSKGQLFRAVLLGQVSRWDWIYGQPMRRAPSDIREHEQENGSWLCLCRKAGPRFLLWDQDLGLGGSDWDTGQCGNQGSTKGLPAWDSTLICLPPGASWNLDVDHVTALPMRRLGYLVPLLPTLPEMGWPHIVFITNRKRPPPGNMLRELEKRSCPGFDMKVSRRVKALLTNLKINTFLSQVQWMHHTH